MGKGLLVQRRTFLKVAAESMHRFVRLLFDSHILQGLIPEVASLSCLTQMRNKEGDTENVFDHTLECMLASISRNCTEDT